MNELEILKLWEEITEDLRRDINHVTLILNLIRGISPEQRRACEAISDALIQAFTLSKFQYKKYLQEVNNG